MAKIYTDIELVTKDKNLDNHLYQYKAARKLYLKKIQEVSITEKIKQRKIFNMSGTCSLTLRTSLVFHSVSLQSVSLVVLSLIVASESLAICLLVN